MLYRLATLIRWHLLTGKMLGQRAMWWLARDQLFSGEPRKAAVACRKLKRIGDSRVANSSFEAKLLVAERKTVSVPAESVRVCCLSIC